MAYFLAARVRRLADELVEARELESFHRLASFVLHDLKTIVSGLSLSLANAERRAGDPAAMELTLRGVSASVARMRQLMERVARARTPGELELECCDVDALVGDCLSESLDEGDRARVRVKILSEGPGRIALDRAHHRGHRVLEAGERVGERLWQERWGN